MDGLDMIIIKCLKSKINHKENGCTLKRFDLKNSDNFFKSCL